MFVRYNRSFNSPLALMDDVRRGFDLFFDTPEAELPARWHSTGRFEVETDEERIRVRAEVPGIEPSAISVSVEGDALTIGAEGERPWKRAFVLPYEVDADKAEAKLKHGVLELVLPKSERAKPKKIAVTSGDLAPVTQTPS